jgi:hypothetical protein
MVCLRAVVLALAMAVGAGCSLILSFDDRVIDGGADGPADALELPVDAGPDRFEANQTPTTATAILPGTETGLTIYPDTDVDYFSFTSPGLADVTVEILFTHQYGDLDLRLFNSMSASPIATSTGFQDDERVSLTGAMQPPAGTYLINVYSSRGSNVYDLVLTVEGGPPPVDGGIDAP